MSGHLIADIHFVTRPFDVRCTCGARFEGPTPERVAGQYAEHQAGLTGAERAANARAGIARSRANVVRVARGAWGVS